MGCFSCGKCPHSLTINRKWLNSMKCLACRVLSNWSLGLTSAFPPLSLRPHILVLHLTATPNSLVNSHSPTLFRNPREMRGRVAVVRRGKCMFEEKALNVQRAGAVGMVVIDNQKDTSAHDQNAFLFAMSGSYTHTSDSDDGPEEKVLIPSVFLFHAESVLLLDQMFAHPEAVVRLAYSALNPAYCFDQTLRRNPSFLGMKIPISNQFLAVDAEKVTLRLHFYFDDVNSQSGPEQKQAVVERNVRWLGRTVHFPSDVFGGGIAKSIFGEAKRSFAFLGHVRALAYSLLGFPNTLTVDDMNELRQMVKHLRLRRNSGGSDDGEEEKDNEEENSPPSSMFQSSRTTSVICRFDDHGKFGASHHCSPLTLTNAIPVHT